MELLCCLFPVDKDEAEYRINREYEASCWIDGITDRTLNDFCSLVQQSANATTPDIVTFALAWRNADLPDNPLPNAHPSAILVQSLQLLTQASDEFTLLTVQVLAKCLLHDANPLPLAALILDASKTVAGHPVFGQLVEYARSVLHFDRYVASKRNDLAMAMLKACFAKDSYPLALLAPALPSGSNNDSSLVDEKLANASQDYVTLVRQLTHLTNVADDANCASILPLIRQILPVAISVSWRWCFD